jgi:hypothetical protein
MEDTEVRLKRHKRKLEQIRNDRQDREQFGDNSTSSERLIQAATGENEGYSRDSEEFSRDTQTGIDRVEIITPTARRFDSRIRSSDATDEYTTQSSSRSYEPSRENALIVDDAESKKERDKELNRQRQARYRERQKESNESEGLNPNFQAQNRYSDVIPITGIGNAGFNFNLKKGNAEPVKLLSKSEAEEAKEALIYVYQKGSSLIDDIVEIITVGHEPIQIWALSEDEATIFAEAHLKKAQKDKNAARSARMLLKIHDKLFLTQYVATRAIATHRHIKNSGGLSFK